jgi:hypothetical protein
MNIQAQVDAMWQAARSGGIPHLNDLKGFLEQEFQAIATAAADIEADKLAGKITAKQAELAFKALKKSKRDVALAVQATLKTAAQDAINAAFSVASTSLRTAIGLP